MIRVEEGDGKVRLLDIKSELNDLTKEIAALKGKQTELKREQQDLEREADKNRYSRTISDEPISWTATPRIMRKHKERLTYLALTPDKNNKTTNPLEVEAPKSQKSVLLVLKDTYVEYINAEKVQVTITPIANTEEAEP